MKNKMFTLCGPLFWERFESDCCRHCSLSDCGDREFGNSSAPKGAPWGSQELHCRLSTAFGPKDFLPPFVFITCKCPTVGINAAAIKPPCLLDTGYCSFSNGFCHTQLLQAWLCLAPEVTALNSVGWIGPFALTECCALHRSTAEALCKTASIFTATLENKQSMQQRIHPQPPWDLSGRSWGDQVIHSLLWQNLSNCGENAQTGKQLWVLFAKQSSLI